MDCGIFCHGDTGCPVDNLIPEFNDFVYKGKWKEAVENLHSTNNFPEFTRKTLSCSCEGACTVGLIDKPVLIKAIERTIIDRAFDEGYRLQCLFLLNQPKPVNSLQQVQWLPNSWRARD